MLIRLRNIHAFTLLEVIIAVAIVAILGAILVPYAAGTSETLRITQTSNDLQAFKAANTAYYGSAAKQQLGRVSFASVSVTTADTTSCNGLQPAGGALVVLYAGADVTPWAGPYMNRANSREGGFVTGIGVIRDIVRRTAANNSVGDLVLMIPNVRLDDAIALNDLMDADGVGNKLTSTIGSIRYPNPNSQLVVDSVTYQFTIAKEC